MFVEKYHNCQWSFVCNARTRHNPIDLFFCHLKTEPSEVQGIFRAGKFYKDDNMFLKAEPTCAHHDNVSIKADIIEIDAGCVWKYNSSLLPGRRILIYI